MDNLIPAELRSGMRGGMRGECLSSAEETISQFNFPCEPVAL